MSLTNKRNTKKKRKTSSKDLNSFIAAKKGMKSFSFKSFSIKKKFLRTRISSLYREFFAILKDICEIKEENDCSLSLSWLNKYMILRYIRCHNILLSINSFHELTLLSGNVMRKRLDIAREGNFFFHFLGFCYDSRLSNNQISSHPLNIFSKSALSSIFSKSFINFELSFNKK